MASWRAILNWWNPTRAWCEDPAKSLVLDLDTHRFCGVGIGETTQSLSFLGPATGWFGGLEYPERRLLIMDEVSLDEIMLYFGHPAEPDGGIYRGEIRYRGEPLALSSATSEEAVLALFGQPYWRDADESETILFYEFPEREWQVEFGTDGRLKCFSMGEPILADLVQRDAYGVTKPWPPS